MIIVVRYLSFAVLAGGFVLVAILPTLFILAMGSRRVGPGRYRGALEAAPGLLSMVAWLTRAKALYGAALVLLVAFGWLELPWLAVAPLAALLIGWEAALEAAGLRARFLKERTQAPDGGASGAALRVLVAGVVSLAAQMSLVFYVIFRSYYLSVL